MGPSFVTTISSLISAPSRNEIKSLQSLLFFASADAETDAPSGISEFESTDHRQFGKQDGIDDDDDDDDDDNDDNDVDDDDD